MIYLGWILGLALSIGVGSCVNALILFCILRRRKIYQPLKGWLKWLTSIIVASIAMGALLVFMQQGIDWAAMQSEWVKRAGLVFVYIGLAIVVYFGVLVVLGLRSKHLRV